MTNRILVTLGLSVCTMLPIDISPAGAAGKPNVVILFTENQGTLDANCYGSTDLITLNIDRLAATGVRFTQAYAHTVCCSYRVRSKYSAAAKTL